MAPNDERGNAPKFLSLALPHWAARGLACAIIAIVLVTVGVAFLIELPETVTADFVLVPVDGADPVKATRRGVVKQVFVSEGGLVNQGDLIATLSSDAAGDRVAERMTVQTQLANAGESFLNAKAKFSAQTLANEQETRRLAARAEHLGTVIQLRHRQLTLLEQMADSYEKLYREGLASRAQLTDRQLEVAEVAAELEERRSERSQARSEIERLRLDFSGRQADFKEVERTYREQIAIREIRLASLKTGLGGGHGNDIHLTAPCSGTILRLHVRNSGAVVDEGETVADVVCAGETLRAELNVPEAGVGKLKTGQGVKLKYDAYPYQRYGVKYGVFTWLSPAAVWTEEGASFKAHVELTENEVMVEGQPRPLVAGMGGRAGIVVGRRSLIDYVFEPLRQWKEDFSDVPERLGGRQPGPATDSSRQMRAGATSLVPQ